MNIYFDNASTTPIDQEVLDTMLPILKDHFGNPSSIHSYGRKTRTVLENSRKTIAGLLNVSPSEIFFTSGGTEANNMALQGGIIDLGLKNIISSPIEHHAVLHTLEILAKRNSLKLSFVKLKKNGQVDLEHLEELLKTNERSLVSLMHANNEIGNLLSLKEISEICLRYNAIFHSDTVQTMAHYRMDLKAVKLHFLSCSAHKFHGPKGVGFLYINGEIKINPLIYGGAQERNMRGGTENVYGIVGLSKALEIAYRDMEAHQEHIQSLKTYMIHQLEQNIPGVEFNGDHNSNSLYTVLNVLFPPTQNAEMFIFNLDIMGIAVSGGSACSSGSQQGSHVLKAINVDQNRPSVRFSFSKFNTKDEIDFCISKLLQLYLVKA